jgi:chemotaxis family two-component system response regulator Rcp1
VADTAPVRLLLVEDNPIDARATLKALKNLNVEYLVEVVEDGDHAIEHLTNGSKSRPDLVLLDLNLPGRDGLDVLDRVKGDPNLRRIPILILTTSANDADVLGAYDLGANAYINKPIDLNGWTDVVAKVEAFWFSLVRLPPT